MKPVGIIVEYNSFHSGHTYHIAQTHAMGYTYICAMMSKNAVMRKTRYIKFYWMCRNERFYFYHRSKRNR